VTGNHNDADGGSDKRTIDRRSVLKGAATGSAALTGAAAFSGTASAGSCLELVASDAPTDFPVVTEYGNEYGAIPEGPNELVVFVHGWQAELGGDAWGQSYTTQMALEAAGFGGEVMGFKYWANNFWWPAAKDDAEDAGGALAAWLQSYMNDYPGTTVRLVAHSLGSRASLKALDELQADGDSVTSLSLLGAAVDADSVTGGGTWEDAVRNGADDVHNFYSNADGILEYIYSIGEFGDEALGEESADGSTPGNVGETDVTDDIDDHCEYFQPDTGCIDDVVAEF